LKSFGTVKWYSDQMGYGFISQDLGGEDVYVSSTVVRSGKCGILEQGDKVRFDTTQATKGLRAMNIERDT
jgi:cold shock protein